MKKARTFLVVADDPERLMLLSATLHRKFPNSVVQTCRDSEAAIDVVRAHSLDAIVAQRSADMDELPLVESLRANTSVPIVLVSGAHYAEAAMVAGASGFLPHEQWLLVGTFVAEFIGVRASEDQAQG